MSNTRERQISDFYMKPDIYLLVCFGVCLAQAVDAKNPAAGVTVSGARHVCTQK